MTVLQEINDLFWRSFKLVKYNMVLTLPFLAFWLIISFIIPTAGAGGAVFSLFLLIAITAAFLSGWFSMFKKCVETPVDQNLPEEKHTYESFNLFDEFFPGVGKYFSKMILGIVMVFLIFNIAMGLFEVIVVPMLGEFESFARQDVVDAMKDADAAMNFWQGISASDQAKILQVAGLEAVFFFLLVYFTMFWSQLVVLEESYPIRALIKSFKVVIKDFARTFAVFFLNFAVIFGIMFISAVVGMNPLIRLVFILLFVYAFIFYVMMTFVYLERYGDLNRAKVDITIGD